MVYYTNNNKLFSHLSAAIKKKRLVLQIGQINQNSDIHIIGLQRHTIITII